MKFKPVNIVIAVGLGVAAYLIWRNIKNTPKRGNSNFTANEDYMNAVGKSSKNATARNANDLGLLWLRGNKGICPPQCD